MISAPSIAASARGAVDDAEAAVLEVAHRLGGGPGVDVVEPHLRDPDHHLHRQRLEFRLRAAADHRHGLRALRCEVARGHSRGRGGAQRRQQRHLAKQHRVAGGDVGEQAEGRDRLQPLSQVFWMAVDVFEAIGCMIGGRHQLDHPFVGMRGDARGLVEAFPPAEILLDRICEFGQHRFDADVVNQPHHVLDTHEGDQSFFRGQSGHSGYPF